MPNDNAAALDLLTATGYALAGLVLGAIVSIALSVTMRLVVRRHPSAVHVSRRAKARQRLLLLLLGFGYGIDYATAPSVAGGVVHWRGSFQHAFLIAAILAIGNFLVGLLRAFEDGVVEKVQDAPESPHARRVETQMQVVSRVGAAVIWLCALAASLYTFQSFRVLGTSIFASAGVLSIVAGLAAQSTLSNLFAGLQLAFTDAIRVGDSVVVHTPASTGGMMGRIEEITLTYVVVRVWDDRRVVLPSTYFTTTAFENWSRRDPAMLGSVDFDLDWMVPIEAMRAEFKRQVSDQELWDGRVSGLQVTDAIGGNVHVRVLVSAANSGNLWDLRCNLREGLLAWLQDQAPYSLPRLRIEPHPTTAPALEEREEFIEEAKRQWEEKQKADDSPDSIATQYLDAAQIAGSSGIRQAQIYGSSRRTGWRPGRKHTPRPQAFPAADDSGDPDAETRTDQRPQKPTHPEVQREP
ncbi:MAG: mechanosensitive ion channel [Propionibacterium sp.]|nr:mechanosensitive ion channel [Propionibacterium sp.]